MHKYDSHIRDFLLSNQTISAEGIGEFSVGNGEVSNGVPVIHFRYDKHAITTAELTAYIAEKEQKNKVLIGFDLEAHLNEVKQFINIGRPWVIPGLGQVQLGKSREYEFVQKFQDEIAVQERRRRKQGKESTNVYGLERTERRNSNNAGAILLTLIIIAVLAVAVYYFLSQNKEELMAASSNDDTVATSTDTLVQVPPSSNMNNTTTVTQPPTDINSSSVTAPANSDGSVNVHFVITRTANSAYAYKRYNQLKTYGLQLSIDSLVGDTATFYKLYLTKSLMTTDTAWVKDSLTKFFGKPVRIEAAER